MREIWGLHCAFAIPLNWNGSHEDPRPPVDAGHGVTRWVLAETPEIMLVEFAFAEGGEGPPHSHPHVQSTFVEAGRPFRLALDEPAAAAQSLSSVGPLDILVNNAGIIRRADAVDFSEADWDDVIDVNLKAVFFLSQAFARAAFARGAGGAIVNIASLLAFQGGIRIPSYTAAKHGVAGLTKLLANEWAARGINVNAVAPGYIETNNTEALRADAARNKAILDRTLGRARGHRGRRRLPGLAGREVRPRNDPTGRWRLACPLTSESLARRLIICHTNCEVG